MEAQFTFYVNVAFFIRNTLRQVTLIFNLRCYKMTDQAKMQEVDFQSPKSYFVFRNLLETLEILRGKIS